MFLQLQAYWQQPVAFLPRLAIGGEIFTCHDLADLHDLRRFLAGRQAPLVYRIARDSGGISQAPVDLQALIARGG